MAKKNYSYIKDTNDVHLTKTEYLRTKLSFFALGLITAAILVAIFASVV